MPSVEAGAFKSGFLVSIIVGLIIFQGDQVNGRTRKWNARSPRGGLRRLVASWGEVTVDP
jgi:hypothetical protein